MVIKDVHLCSKLDIWAPRYSDMHGSEGEWVVLLSKSKVYHSSPVLLINFSRAKHLQGQRFAIKRTAVEQCPITTNGKIDCFVVNMSKLEHWMTPQEEYAEAMGVFDD